MTSEEVIVSMFVTILIIYFSKFVSPTTGIQHIDSLIAHIKRNDGYMGYAVMFSALVTVVTAFFMEQLAIEYLPRP